MGVCGGAARSRPLTELLLTAEVIGPQPTFFHLRDKQTGSAERLAWQTGCCWSKGLINISICRCPDKTRTAILRRAPSVRRAGWRVMMVIFHVCYHNLHASISQITDVTGTTCRASVLMKMVVVGTPGNAQIPEIDWVIATLRRRWKCTHQRINTPQWIIKQTVWARAEIHLLYCFLLIYFCFIRQKQDPDFQFHWRINIFSF